MAVNGGGRRGLRKRGGCGGLRCLSLGTTAAAFVAEQNGRIRCGPKEWRNTEYPAEEFHLENEFFRSSRRTRSPLANSPVGGPGREAGREQKLGLGDRKAVKVLVTAAVNEQEGKHRRA